MTSDEQLVEAMSQGRMISAADNLLYPMIKKMIEERLKSACARFNGGEREFIADIAYIQSLKAIELKLKHAQEAGNKAYLQLDKTTKEKR